MPAEFDDLYDKLYQKAVDGNEKPFRRWLEKDPTMTDCALRNILEAVRMKRGGSELVLRRQYLDMTKCRKCLDLDHSGWCRGDGPVPCDLMFVGESPGKTEARVHRPFVGPAGNLLTRLLSAINLDRDRVFVTNTVKCFQAEKSDLTTDHADTCRRWLLAEIRLVKPRRIVALGRYAWESIFGPHKGKLEGLRREWRYVDMDRWEQTCFPTTISVAFLYHPAAALRQDIYLLKLQEDFGWLADQLGVEWRETEGKDEFSYAEIPEVDSGYDFGGKAHFEGDEVVLDFGKRHKGDRLSEVADFDPSYLTWIMDEDNDFPSDLVTACKEALRGKL